MQLQNGISALASPPCSTADPATINCDLIAPWYEPVEHLCFGRALERRRNAYLGDLRDVRTALSCGAGDGRFMTALLQANPQVTVTAIDASRRMVEIASRRMLAMAGGLRARADYHCAPVQSFHPPQTSFDLIATHFFLDCFSTEDAAAIIHRLAGWAAPRAHWIVSEFCQPATPVGRFWTGAIIRSLYAAFRVTTGLRTTRLPDYRPALLSEGFELRQQEHACGGLLVSELWERR
jgi:ubiquinone/menaquinone biosynthesis C-methylase UbiE